MTELPPDDPSRQLDARIATFAARRRRSRAGRGRSLWTQATQVGTVGWLIAVPIAAGALLGHLIDTRLGTGITFAMAFIALGMLVSGYALWRLGFDLRAHEESAAADEVPTAEEIPAVDEVPTADEAPQTDAPPSSEP